MRYNRPLTNKRGPRTVDGKLKMAYGNHPDDGYDIITSWGNGCSVADARLLHLYLCSERPPIFPDGEWSPSLIEELEARGYDITTLKFSIERKKECG